MYAFSGVLNIAFYIPIQWVISVEGRWLNAQRIEASGGMFL